MMLSDCCSASGDWLYAEVGICPACKEHCEVYDDEEEEDEKDN